VLASGHATAYAHDAHESTLRRLGAHLLVMPADVEARLRRAELLRRTAAFDGALLDVAELRRRAPADLRPLVLLVHLLADTGHDVLALRVAHAYFARGGKDARVHAIVARRHARRGRTRAALRSYAEAARAKADPDVFLEWATLLARTGARAESLDIYRRGLAALGDSVVLRMALVDALLASRGFAAALPEIEHVLASSRVRAPWLVLRARVLRGLGRVDEARADLEGALEESERMLARRRTSGAASARAEAVHLLAQLPKGGR